MLVDNDGNKYTKVEYLESTGTQYIDTGYIASDNTEFKIQYSLTKKPSDFQAVLYKYMQPLLQARQGWGCE